MHADPVPAITEAAATGETAVIFADLRATLGVDVVNLIWRHIATFPGALTWAWATLKPVYVSGRVGVEAQHIKAGLALPELPGWPRPVLHCAGIDAAGENSIRRILASYNRSNAMNLSALSALVRRIDGVPLETQSDLAAPELLQEPSIEGRLPKLLALDEVSADTAQLIRSINLLGDRAKGRIIASMYRHVAHWPGFLALSHVQLAPLAHDGRLDNLIGQTVTLGERAGARLQAALPNLPSPETVPEIRRAAADFIQHAIGKMVPIAALLMASMPK
ncbi:MAG: hypothetical protein EXR29_03755 [Betaproteobacteria bacterium]|nr:hypothetical protein [Betaproteobacteria bacterium]